MAGSWQHMTTRAGRLRDNESFCRMIENLGDAYEAAEECYGMIWWLATQLAEDRAPGLATREQAQAVITEAEQHYKDGLRLGRVSRDR
jgi:hypothetical protein